MAATAVLGSKREAAQTTGVAEEAGSEMVELLLEDPAPSPAENDWASQLKSTFMMPFSSEQSRSMLLQGDSGAEIVRLRRVLRLCAFGVAVLIAITAALVTATVKLAVDRPDKDVEDLLALEDVNPTIILVSLDGFRWDYINKVYAPNLEFLCASGTHASVGMLPVFPSETFPSHYSMATGLYPPWHGIVGNTFRDPEDGSIFTMSSKEPKWWLGEPIWMTATKQGVRAATAFWPGSETQLPPWDCDPRWCLAYNGSMPYEARIDTVLGYLDLPIEERPRFMTAYVNVADTMGHIYGPDSPQVAAAVQQIDSVVGRLVDGLRARGLLDSTHLIVVSDHGMASTCANKVILLDELLPTMDLSWVEYYSPVLGIRPPDAASIVQVYENLTGALLQSNAQMSLYFREDVPEHLHFSYGDRVPPIVGIAQEGYVITTGERMRANLCGCGGTHGYENSLLSMRATFIARGPRFRKAHAVSPFVSVELYNIMADILRLTPAPSNGSAEFARELLLGYR